MKMKSQLVCAVLLSAAPLLGWAQSCEVTVESSDTMRYSLRSISVPKSCETFKVTLKHTGRMPKTAMGHNWVLGKSSEIDAIIKDGQKAGSEHDFLKPDDTRIIAKTALIGGGETADTTITTSNLKPGESYTFICSYPGHWSMMRGTLKLEA